MKKEKGRACRQIVWILFTAVVYLLAFGFYLRVQEGKNLVVVKLQGAFPNANETEKMYELEQEQEAPVDFTMWQSMGERWLENPENGKKCQVQFISLCPRTDIFWEKAGVLDMEDKEGCLIDEQTAWTLFSSRDVAGEKLTIEGTSYVIRRVLEGSQPMVLLQGKGTETVFSLVSFRIKDKQSKSQTVEEFLIRYHLEGEIVDSSILPVLGKGLLLVLPVLLLVRFLLLLWKAWEECGGCFWQRALLVLAMLGCTVFFFFGISRVVSISRDMIPSRWSDFSFWSVRLAEKKGELLRFLQNAKSPGQMEQLGAFAKSGVFSLLACLGYGLSLGSGDR